jgi:hypothetical protein
MKTSHIALALFAATSILAAGCAEYRLPPPAIVHVPPDQARIVFDADAFASTTPVRVRYSDFWQSEEYARFQGRGAQAEVIQAQIDYRERVALDYNLVIEDMVETWNYNKGRAKTWGKAEGTRTPLSRFWYRPYALKDKNQSCVGFTTDGNLEPNDPKYQRWALFGYYCAAPGETLTKAQMEQLVNSVGILGVSKPRWKAEVEAAKTGVPRIGDAPGDPVQIARAGTAGGEAGNPRFPFLFARWISPSEGPDRR